GNEAAGGRVKGTGPGFKRGLSSTRSGISRSSAGGSVSETSPGSSLNKTAAAGVCLGCRGSVGRHRWGRGRHWHSANRFVVVASWRYRAAERTGYGDDYKP